MRFPTPPPIALQTGFPLPVADGLLVIQQINQMALVVRDLEPAVHAYWDRLRIGPWRFYTYGPKDLSVSLYRGLPAAFTLRLAYTWVGPLQLEIIQPLDGPSVYADFLRAHGEGVHHVGLFVEDFDAAVQAFEARGYVTTQMGRGFGLRGDGGFAYMEMDGLFGVTIELISPPKERRPPEMIYPPEADPG